MFDEHSTPSIVYLKNLIVNKLTSTDEDLHLISKELEGQKHKLNFFS
jgi:hypothetical protein